MAFLAIGIAFVIAKGGVTIGVLLISMVVGLPVLIFLITDPTFGFYLILILSFFISFIQRISNGAIPIIVLEVLLLLVILGLVLNQIRTRNASSINWKYLKHPITIYLLLWTLYVHLQFFNPNANSLIGKLIAIRYAWYNLFGFLLALTIFKDIRHIKIFFQIFLFVSFLAALYGLSQKYIGLLPFEHDWFYSSPVRLLHGLIWGQLRAWSFLNDPANFGLLMAFSSLLCLIFAIGPSTTKEKIILGIGGLVMLVAMVSSGTRTAFVMVPIGFGVFGLLTINKIKTALISSLVVVVLLGIYFGPFYSAPINRVRSAFQGNDDPSMNVRSINKKRIQPYILTHPIGGGANTTGEVGKLHNPSHPLAGFPPDSGYLRVALEMGFIGFILTLMLYYKTISISINRYFETTNYRLRTIYLAIISSLIALCTAELTQLATTIRPFDFIVFSYFAMIVRLENVDKEKELK